MVAGAASGTIALYEVKEEDNPGQAGELSKIILI